MQNTRENTPAHCWDCWKFKDCHQAQQMTADTPTVPGFADTAACDHVCEDCARGGNLYPLDNEEIDYPAHCCQCGAPLEHRLTTDGAEYVRQSIEEGAGCCCELWPVVWADYLEAQPTEQE